MKTTRTSTAVVAAALVVCLYGVSPGATITLQPDGDAGKDVLVMVTVTGDSDIYALVVNHDIGVVSGEYDNPFFIASFVEFDLTSFDPSATVTSATMGVYAYEAGADGDYSLHEVTDPWTEPAYHPGGEVTAVWLTLPATNTVAEDSVTFAADASGWLTWDVTSLVSNWVDGSSANHGVLIAGDTGAIELWMSEHTDPALRPYLQIDYAPVPEPTTLVLLATGLLAIAGWRRRRTGKG